MSFAKWTRLPMFSEVSRLQLRRLVQRFGIIKLVDLNKKSTIRIGVARS